MVMEVRSIKSSSTEDGNANSCSQICPNKVCWECRSYTRRYNAMSVLSMCCLPLGVWYSTKHSSLLQVTAKRLRPSFVCKKTAKFILLHAGGLWEMGNSLCGVFYKLTCESSLVRSVQQRKDKSSASLFRLMTCPMSFAMTTMWAPFQCRKAKLEKGCFQFPMTPGTDWQAFYYDSLQRIVVGMY